MILRGVEDTSEVVYTELTAVRDVERMNPMTYDRDNKELYAEILEVYKHYMVNENPHSAQQKLNQQIHEQNPYQYQKVPSIYDTVPTVASNKA